MLNTPTVALALGALAAIILAILGGARMLRATGFTPTARRLRVVDQISLGRSTLRIIACDGREMLIISGGTQDTMLGWLERAP